jgi:fructose-bisphosphate aldolase, class II
MIQYSVMRSLREHIREADKRGIAIGHFNFSNIEMLWGIFSAAKELDLPVIVGVSEGERSFVGTKQAVALVESIREEHDFPIFINADHTYSYDGVVEAVDAGYDSVIFDGAKISMDENIEITKKCVEYARESNRDVMIEGELGYIGGSSKLLDEVPEGAQITEDALVTADDAKKYVEATGIDLLAPAVGNLHGMLKNASNPALNIERIKEIREVCGIPLVLHGGSGVSNKDFRASIRAGIAEIHVSTELRIAYKEALKKTLADDSDELAPYRIMKPVVMAVKAVVMDRLRLFNS